MGFWTVKAPCQKALWKTTLLLTCVWITTHFVSHAAVINELGNRITSDGCDWNGSGLDTRHESTRTVHPVYLRCREGRIQWHYPRRALRIVLVQVDRKEFQACFLLHSNSAHAAAYVEGGSSLHRIFDDQRQRRSFCFQSRDARLVVFLEAQPAFEVLRKNLVDFSYDLQPVGSYDDECRPCTDKELLYHFCAADFAVRGTVESVRHMSILQRTEVSIMATRVIQDTQQRVFGGPSSTGTGPKHAVLYRPLQCGTKTGQGDFLFLGRWKLDTPFITCAPRWKEWKKLKRKAILGRTSDCLLS